jgi:cell division initiation protein
MKITPLEIRQKEFEKKLRGYDKDEVQAFLLSLSNEWERVLDEHKDLRMKLAHAEKEVQKLRDVESSLYKTLKTAEDTGANLVDQANRAAELHLRETQMKAESMMNESKQKARAIIEKAEQEAKEIINEVQEGVKELDLNYKTIENHRDNLIKDLMNLANDIVERVQRTDKQKSNFKLQDQIKRVRDFARESERRINA